MAVSAALAGGLALALGASLGANAVLLLRRAGHDLTVGEDVEPGREDGGSGAQQMATVDTT